MGLANRPISPLVPAGPGRGWPLVVATTPTTNQTGPRLDLLGYLAGYQPGFCHQAKAAAAGWWPPPGGCFPGFQTAGAKQKTAQMVSLNGRPGNQPANEGGCIGPGGRGPYKMSRF